MFDLVCSSFPYQDNTTPLYVASQEGHHDVVQSLLGAGAAVNIARSDVSVVTCALGTCMYMYIVVRTDGSTTWGMGVSVCLSVCIMCMCVAFVQF